MNPFDIVFLTLAGVAGFLLFAGVYMLAEGDGHSQGLFDAAAVTAIAALITSVARIVHIAALHQ